MSHDGLPFTTLIVFLDYRAHEAKMRKKMNMRMLVLRMKEKNPEERLGTRSHQIWREVARECWMQAQPNRSAHSSNQSHSRLQLRSPIFIKHAINAASVNRIWSLQLSQQLKPYSTLILTTINHHEI